MKDVFRTAKKISTVLINNKLNNKINIDVCVWGVRVGVCARASDYYLYCVYFLKHNKFTLRVSYNKVFHVLK